MKLFVFKAWRAVAACGCVYPGHDSGAGEAEQPAAIVIVNAQVSDGSDAPLKKVSVRIVGDRVTKIGVFKPVKGEQVIDAQGLVLAPGFIDIHNHSAEGLDKDPLAETQISQGITTVILGPDGFSPWPIGGMDGRPAQSAGCAECRDTVSDMPRCGHR